MATIYNMPACPTIDDIDWSIEDSTQVNRSEWTRGGQTLYIAGATIWRASFSVSPLMDPKVINEWRAFLFRLQGRANAFRLPTVWANQHEFSDIVRVAGANQGGFQLTVDGLLPGRQYLEAGQFVTLTYSNGDEQLLGLTQPFIATGNGTGVLTFSSLMRMRPADNAVVETKRPWAVMKLTTDERRFAVTSRRVNNISLECEEWFPSIPSA